MGIPQGLALYQQIEAHDDDAQHTGKDEQQHHAAACADETADKTDPHTALYACAVLMANSMLGFIASISFLCFWTVHF